MKDVNFVYDYQEEAIFSTLSQNCPDLETLKIGIYAQGDCFHPLPKLKYFQLFTFSHIFRIFINPYSECDTKGKFLWNFYSFSAIVKIAQGCPLLEQLYLGGTYIEFPKETAQALSQCKNLSVLKFPKSGGLDGMTVNQILKVTFQLIVLTSVMSSIDFFCTCTSWWSKVNHRCICRGNFNEISNSICFG